MTFDLQKILESKRALRRKLAALPVAEKLRMLDALRERALPLGHTTAQPVSAAEVLRSAPPPSGKE